MEPITYFVNILQSCQVTTCVYPLMGMDWERCAGVFVRVVLSPLSASWFSLMKISLAHPPLPKIKQALTALLSPGKMFLKNILSRSLRSSLGRFIFCVCFPIFSHVCIPMYILACEVSWKRCSMTIFTQLEVTKSWLCYNVTIFYHFFELTTFTHFRSW